MEVDIDKFGASKITFMLPKKFPKDWDDKSTSHNIIVNNGIGVSSYDFKTETVTEE